MSVEKEESVFLDENVYERVPLNKRESWLSFIMIFMGIWASINAMSIGVNIGPQLTPWKSSLALFLGYMICLAYGILIGNIGRREGLSTSVLCEKPFSKFGKIIPSLLIFLIGAVFIGVQADSIARILLDMVGVDISEGFSVIRGFVAAALCAIMMWTSYQGIQNIKLISWITIPVFNLVLIISLVITIKSYPGSFSSLLFLEANKISFSSVVFLGASTYAGFTAYMSDVSRFMRTKGDLLKALIIGYIASTFVPIWGIFVGAAQGTSEYWTVFSQFGVAFAIFAAIGLYLAQWSTNDNNAFSSGLALSTIFTTLNTKYKKFPRLTRKQATLVPIIIGLIFSFVGPGAVNWVIVIVGSLGSWTIPLAGILIAHYYLLEKRGKQVETKGIAGLSALIAAGGLTQLGLVPFPAVTSLLLSMVLYVFVYYAIERPLFGEIVLNNLEQQVHEELGTTSINA